MHISGITADLIELTEREETIILIAGAAITAGVCIAFWTGSKMATRDWLRILHQRLPVTEADERQLTAMETEKLLALISLITVYVQTLGGDRTLGSQMRTKFAAEMADGRPGAQIAFNLASVKIVMYMLGRMSGRDAVDLVTMWSSIASALTEDASRDDRPPDP